WTAALRLLHAFPTRRSSDLLEPGGILRLGPGESVTLLPGVWHAFWAEEKDVLIGEVSTVNDDLTDNVFAEPVSRFSKVEEDEERSEEHTSELQSRENLVCRL